MPSIFRAIAVAALLASPSFAGDVQVDAAGTVLFTSATGGPFAGAVAGSPVTMSFRAFTPGSVISPGQYDVHSIDKPSFVLSIGPGSSGLTGNEPLGISNDFPVADGVFVFVTPLQPGSAFEFELHDSTGTAFATTKLGMLAGTYPASAFDTVDWNVFTGGGQIAIGLTSLSFGVESAPAIGTPYCTSNPNSSGSPALIQAQGSASVAAEHVTLVASQLPADKNVLFFYGSQRVQVPFDAGFVCAGGANFRLLPAQNSGPQGVVARVLDFDSAPVGSGPGAFLPGSTWHAQCWFRDPPATNFTNGVSITLVP